MLGYKLWGNGPDMGINVKTKAASMIRQPLVRSLIYIKA